MASENGHSARDHCERSTYARLESVQLNRRHLVSFLAAAVVGAASGSARASLLTGAEGTTGTPVEFPPFELEGSASALRNLASNIDGWRVDRLGNRASNVWLRSSDGAVWLIEVEQQDVQPMFEVFTLGMRSMSELYERWERWEPPLLPQGVPEGLHRLLTTRPAAPAAPAHFDPWPLRSWRTDVVRRAEFIIEGEEVGPTFGNNPNTQSSARPGAVPALASAFCEVAAGVLFTGEGQHLLLAVDWTPTNILVLQDAGQIGTFLADCELISIADYLNGRPA